MNQIKLITRYVLLAAYLTIAIAPSPVMALSCRFPDIKETFTYLNDSSGTYIVVRGNITVERQSYQLRPEKSPITNSSYRSYMVKVEGYSASSDGFNRPFSSIVEFRQDCIIWPNKNICEYMGQADRYTNKQSIIYFFQKTDVGYAFSSGDCSGGFFNDTPENIQQVIDCMQGKNCEVDDQ